MIRDSDNDEAKKLKLEIDAMRKKRDKLISEMKSHRRMINYKQQEYTALSKFLEIDANKPNQSEIIHLKKQKNRLEFKLSTEPRLTLDMERELIRRINEISSKLNTKLRYASLEKKFNLLKGDVKNYSSKIEEVSNTIKEINQQTDDMYSKLKAMLGIKDTDRSNMRPINRSQNLEHKRKHAVQEQKINLKDIAIITRKNKNKNKDDN